VAYQWFLGCKPIEGATNASLNFSNAQPADVGNYHVVVMNASSHLAISEDAALELGPDPKALSRDKVADLFPELYQSFAGGPKSISLPAGVILIGYGTIDSQSLNNSSSTTSLEESNHCGVLGGASQWLRVQTTNSALLQVDTIGSDIDTVLAVYAGNTVNTLKPVICDNNSAPDGIRSLVKFSAYPTNSYLLAADGVNGAKGNIKINWRFGDGPVIHSVFVTRGSGSGGGTLSADASTATKDETYQWFFNGQRLSGATNTTLAVTNMQFAQSGMYSLMVSNFAGFVSNRVVPLNYGLVRSNNNTWNFRLTGPISGKTVLWRSTNCSTNLNDWQIVYTNRAGNTNLIYEETNIGTNRSRFYQLRPAP
jgi:hypothetical protein